MHASRIYTTNYHGLLLARAFLEMTVVHIHPCSNLTFASKVIGQKINANLLEIHICVQEVRKQYEQS